MVDAKIELLEQEVFKKLNTKEDLQKAPYISMRLIALMCEQSQSDENGRHERLEKLQEISSRLKYEIRMIDFCHNMSSQIEMTRRAYANQDQRMMDTMKTWPDFVIETTRNTLRESELDPKYKDQLGKIIEDAQYCKRELRIS